LLKNAFIFSALSGLRWSDIEKLTWSEVQNSGNDYYIRFRQKKTKGAETLPISEQAFNLLGKRGKPEEKVFDNLKYSAWNNLKLREWVMKAGITKHITFHCARHTYATLQLNLGTDIYTVSKLLGHRHLKTTEVYAKVMDKKKQEAANRIQLEL
jgi:integrase